MLDKFQKDVIEKVADANALQPKYEQPKTSRLKVAKCRPSRGCCADKKDKHNHSKPAESSDSRLVFDLIDSTYNDLFINSTLLQISNHMDYKTTFLAKNIGH